MKKPKSKGKAAILFNDFGPYHVARIDGLASALKDFSWSLLAVRMSEHSDTYGWKPELPSMAPTKTLCTSFEQGKLLSSIKASWRFWILIRKENVDAVFLPSYSPLVNFLCLLVTKASGRVAIMMNESWMLTQSKSTSVNFLKKLVIPWFNAAVVGGVAQRKYLEHYGLNHNSIFYGYDVVDNERIYNYQSNYLADKKRYFQTKDGQKRFFLSLGRFVYKKNLVTLLKAYARLYSADKTIDVSLFFVGEGPDKDILIDEAKNLGVPVFSDLSPTDQFPTENGIFFFPFQQVDVIPLFYTFAEAFILPSIFEEWGLVVNEAMACSTPVIVSQNVGSQFELVKDGVNGYLFDPYSEVELSNILVKYVSNSSLSAAQGAEGRKIISQWSPAKFGSSGVSALRSSNILC